ncbi:N-acetylgalactosamine kinase [Ostrinia nubilalis]|uniref:N-acetylgalactosamine kinase n=1 Tax=Ostrinia furnacalis TaxID=93504 RepID=UPI00103AD9D4|nr:N-acetylgalactosamine kinase [Ostrinia furnacalis]
MSDVKIDEVPITGIPSDKRITQIKNDFFEEFGTMPQFIVKVPGRVNIIGEHIDYCGYPVLPLALEQDILIGGKPIDVQELHLRNTNKKYIKYSTKLLSFEDLDIKADETGKPYWYNYVLCGIKGAIEYLNNEIVGGLQLCIDGNIPPASGLSSSSALVSAACLSFLYAQKVYPSKTEIASLCAKSERYIGTQGGGMDQAIAFLAEKYSAQYITFDPLQAKPVSLPENAVFVVAHSLAEANKAATNDFNRRVIECRLAAKILAVSNGASLDQKIINLSQVQKNLNKSLDEMISLVDEFLCKNSYTKNEVCDMLNITEKELNDIYLTPNTKHLSEFKLRQRALHVYKEAMRVESFRKICEDNFSNGSCKNGTNGSSHTNGNSGSLEPISVLGTLMTESHESLKKLYECSHVNLDRLVDISKAMNVHSRLTGAGWGGCIVALCPKEIVDNYIETLVDKFYVQYCNIDKNEALAYVFATTPSHGAVIYK